MDILLYQFNNYYNRILKYHDRLEEYGEPIYTADGNNFNPNDQVSASHIVNYDGSPIDYFIVADEDQIVSRWYIIDSVRIRGGQYRLSLYRDTLADFRREVLNSTVYLEIGWCDINDPAIYNQENFMVNEIKTAEALIRDQSACPWIVGYYDKTAVAEDLTGAVNIKNENLVFTELTGDLNSWEFYSYLTEDFQGIWIPNTGMIRTRFSTLYANIGDAYYGYLNINKQGSLTSYTKDKSAFTNSALKLKTEVAQTDYSQGIGMYNVQSAFSKSIQETTTRDQLFALAEAFLPNPSKDEVNEYFALEGKLLKTLDGKFYRIRLEYKPNIVVDAPITYNSNLYINLANICSNAEYSQIGKIFATSPDGDTFSIRAVFPVYRLYADPAPEFEATFDLYNADRGGALQTQGTPYNIFAIPYGEIDITNDGDTTGETYTIGSKDSALATAAAIQNKLQAKLYDIQLLPYFPYQYLFQADNSLKIPNTQTVSYVMQADEKITVIFNCPYAKFEARNLRLSGDEISLLSQDTVLERKVARQCNHYRLCSPNYANYFDFSAELNNGVRRFTADCEYKPYSPYIHINPDFGGLYGRDFNDPRGLILGGDFSLTQVISAWQTYQINNKNYEKIFDRQIENLEVQQKYGKTQDIVNAISGTFTAAASGATTGFAASGGNIFATAGTAVASGLASLGAGIADVGINQALRDEAKDYTRDLYEFNLQNIQALPITLSKVSAINPNNKLYPVLEFYTCTEIEKEAFRNKIRYNGLSLERIGTILDSLNSVSADDENLHYFKGKLIRTDISDDMHITNTIANELNKGVFI